MKKTLTLVLALLLAVVLSTGTAMAKPDNNNAPGQVKKAEKQQARELVKQSVQEQYQVFIMLKTNESKKVHFPDISQHWAATCIEEMTVIGLFEGYPDGSFKPDQELTQAEALALVMRIAEDDDSTADVDEDQSQLDKVPEWIRRDADKAARKGVINLNRFHSAVQASRAQTAVMVAKALGLEPVDTTDMPFKDGILISQEDVGYILALYQEGILKGTPNGKFNPNSAITRAEMATILQRLLDKEDVISIDLPETAQVEQGKSITLEATVKYPDDSSDNSITWLSSDTSLVTVEDGVVTAAEDKIGTVTITATATNGDLSESATCEVTIIEEEEQVTTGIFEEAGNVGIHEGKIYEEYVLKVDDEEISLHEDDVKSITLQKDNDSAVELTANTDKTLWFNVQRDTGEYTFRVVDKDDNIYEAILDWTAPSALLATATGDEGEYDGNNYIEYQLGSLDLSSFDYMYQIKPDGTVVELTANSDSTLWFKTNDQISGKHTFLINKSGIWYTAIITY